MMMIKITLAVFAVLLFAACQQSNIRSENGDHHEGQQQAVKQEHHEGLSLNDGKKWKSDENTLKHTAKLEAQLSDFRKNGKSTLSDYKLLASALSSELNGLVTDCKISGPAHDALHGWLEPILQNVSNLKKTSTSAEGSEIVQSLNKRVKLFKQYFN